jgi:phage gpG-like protein
MIGVKVNQEQLQKQLNRLRDASLRIADTNNANRAVAVELFGFVMRNFQTEGGMTEAGSWEELADSTVEWKERRGYSMILQNEGELRDSFQMMYSPLFAGVGAAKLPPVARSALQEARTSDKEFDRKRRKGQLPADAKPVSLNLRSPDIAAVHEFGSGNVPARPMLPTFGQALVIAMNVYNATIWEKKR